LHLSVGRLNGDRLDFDLVVPDEVAAVVLKALAIRVRYKATDIVDVWRCLEIAFAAGVKPNEFSEGEPARAAGVVRRLFADRDGRGMNNLATEQRLAAAAADRRYTRIRALEAGGRFTFDGLGESAHSPSRVADVRRLSHTHGVDLYGLVYDRRARCERRSEPSAQSRAGVSVV
jgi:hypothetical protein